MGKRILLTGATDGIGLETARALHASGHQLLLHGRDAQKLAAVCGELEGAEGVIADLGDLADVARMAEMVAKAGAPIHALINNAGVYKARDPRAANGMDLRFIVNTVAPYLLTKRLLPVICEGGRVVNLSSAAQAPVRLAQLTDGATRMADMEAYAQSKRAIALWSAAIDAQTQGIAIMSVNPGSLLASKMVKEGFGVAGNDLGIGVDILRRMALSEEFADAGGRYWDNDNGRFAPVAPEGGADGAELIAAMDAIIAQATGSA